MQQSPKLRKCMHCLFLYTKPATTKKQFLLLESLLLCRVVGAFGNDAHEVFREDKGNPLSVDAKLLFLVVQKVSKVNVKDLKRRENSSVSQWWWLILNSMWKTWRGERTLQFHNGGGWFSTQCERPEGERKQFHNGGGWCSTQRERPEEEKEHFIFTMVVADSQLNVKDLKRREDTSVSQWWWLILNSMWKTWRGERTLQFHNGGGWFSTQCERPEEERGHFSFTMVVADSQLNVKDLKRREDTSVSQWWWLILNSMWKTWRGEKTVSQWWWLVLNSAWKAWRGERTLHFHNGGGWFSTQCERPEEERGHFSFTMVVADSQLNVKDLKRREDTSVSQWWWLILNSMWKTWRGERTLQFHNGGGWSVQMKGKRERCRDTDRDRELFCFPHNTVRSSEWRENHVFQMSALTTGWLLQPLITHPPQWPQGDHHRHW